MKLTSAFLIIYLLVSSTNAKASYEENSRRYLSAQELIWAMANFFPMDTAGVPQSCTQITESNSSVTGVNSPKTGEPVSPVPGQGTIVWLVGCVAESLSPGIVSANPTKLRLLIGNTLYDQLNTGAGISINLQQPWSTLNDQTKLALLQVIMAGILGPDDVVADFGFIQDQNAFRVHLLDLASHRTDADILDVIRFFSVNLAIRDEFLSY